METRIKVNPTKINPTMMTEQEAEILGGYLAKSAETHFDTHSNYNYYYNDKVYEFTLSHFNLILDEDKRYTTDQEKIYRVYSIHDEITDDDGEKIRLTIGEGGNNKLKKPIGSISVKLNKNEKTKALFSTNTDMSLVRITNPKSAEQKREANAYGDDGNNPEYNPEETVKKYLALKNVFEHINRRSLNPRQKKIKSLYQKHVSLENYLEAKSSFDVIIDYYTQYEILPLKTVLNSLLLPLLKAYIDQIHNAKHVHRDIKPTNILLDSDLENKTNVYFIDIEDALRVGKKFTDRFGTPGFIPLSVLTEREDKKLLPRQRESRDLFALALVLIFYLNPNYDVENYISEHYLYNLASMSDKKNGNLIIKFECLSDGLKYRVLVKDKMVEDIIQWQALPEQLWKNVPLEELEEKILKDQNIWLPPILAITKERNQTKTITPYQAAWNMYTEMGGIFNIKTIQKVEGSNLFDFVTLVTEGISDDDPDAIKLKEEMSESITDMMLNDARALDNQENSIYYFAELEKFNHKIDELARLQKQKKEVQIQQENEQPKTKEQADQSEKKQPTVEPLQFPPNQNNSGSSSLAVTPKSPSSPKQPFSPKLWMMKKKRRTSTPHPQQRVNDLKIKREETGRSFLTSSKSLPHTAATTPNITPPPTAPSTPITEKREKPHTDTKELLIEKRQKNQRAIPRKLFQVNPLETIIGSPRISKEELPDFDSTKVKQFSNIIFHNKTTLEEPKDLLEKSKTPTNTPHETPTQSPRTPRS